MGLPWWERPGFDPWVGKIAWRREWQPSPVFLPGNFHGQRSLAGYSPWDRKELDTNERLTLSLSSKSFIVLTFTFRFLIYFELIFLYGVR